MVVDGKINIRVCLETSVLYIYVTGIGCDAIPITTKKESIRFGLSIFTFSISINNKGVCGGGAQNTLDTTPRNFEKSTHRYFDISINQNVRNIVSRIRYFDISIF